MTGRRLKDHERIVEIMNAISEVGPLPYADLVERLDGLTTVDHVRKLVSIAEDRNLLRASTDKGDLPDGLTSGQANATHYVEIGRSSGCVIGVTAGRTYIAVGVADPNGRLLSIDGERPDRSLQGEDREIAWDNHHAGQLAILKREDGEDGRVLLRRCAEQTVAWVEALGVGEEEIRGITLSLPVPVDTPGARTLTTSIEPGLGNVVDIEAEFKKKLGPNRYPKLEKVVVANDADVAARGEIRYGKAYGKQDVIAIHAAYGIGAGIISAGKVLRSSAGGGLGEIGHCMPAIKRDEGAAHGLVPLDPEDELFKCDCGCFGHLEALAGGIAIVRRIEASRRSDLAEPPPELVAEELEQWRSNPARCLEAVLKASFGSAPWIPGREAVLDAAHMIGGAVHTLTHLLKPEAIFLTGKLSEAGEPFLAMVEEGLRSPGSLQNYEPTIELGEARNEFGRQLILVRGAAMTAVRATKRLISREDLELLEIGEN